jgi:hypothetical protein
LTTRLFLYITTSAMNTLKRGWCNGIQVLQRGQVVSRANLPWAGDESGISETTEKAEDEQ